MFRKSIQYIKMSFCKTYSNIPRSFITSAQLYTSNKFYGTSTHSLVVASLAGVAFRGKHGEENEDTDLQETVKNAMIYLGLIKDEIREDTELEKTIKRGIILKNKGEYNKSEKMFHLALKIAQDTQHRDGVTYVYDMLANLAFDTENWSKAETLFQNVMRRLIADGVDQVDNKIISISMKMAKIYWATGKKQEAELGYQFCIENLEKKKNEPEGCSVDTLLMLSRSLHEYGLFQLENLRVQESFTNIKKSYDVFVTAKGTDFDQTVVLLCDLGTVCMFTKDYDKALKFHEDALAIAMRLPEKFEGVSAIHINIGQLFLLQNRLEEAEKSCVVGRRLAEKNDDKETFIIADQLLKEIRTLKNRK